MTEAPKFAAYGYDEAAGTWESPEPHPDITATNWIWSDQDKVKRWDRTAFSSIARSTFSPGIPEQPCFREPLDRRPAHAVGPGGTCPLGKAHAIARQFAKVSSENWTSRSAAWRKDCRRTRC